MICHAWSLIAIPQKKYMLKKPAQSINTYSCMHASLELNVYKYVHACETSVSQVPIRRRVFHLKCQRVWPTFFGLINFCSDVAKNSRDAPSLLAVSNNFLTNGHLFTFFSVAPHVSPNPWKMLNYRRRRRRLNPFKSFPRLKQVRSNGDIVYNAPKIDDARAPE
jgi:hypothetical protein